eukprot:gene2669-3342_t
MPKAKAKKEHQFTKTKPKKDRKAKEDFVVALREALDEYPHVYVFDIMNLRSEHLKEVRLQAVAPSARQDSCA